MIVKLEQVQYLKYGDDDKSIKHRGWIYINPVYVACIEPRPNDLTTLYMVQLGNDGENAYVVRDVTSLIESMEGGE